MTKEMKKLVPTFIFEGLVVILALFCLVVNVERIHHHLYAKYYTVTSEVSYAMDGKIFLIDENGNVWEYSDKDTIFICGEKYRLIMDDNGHETVTDDIILDIEKI